MYQLTLTKPSKKESVKRGTGSIKNVTIVKAVIVYENNTVYASHSNGVTLLSAKDLEVNGRKFYWTIDIHGNLTKIILLEVLNTTHKLNKYRYKNGATVEGYIKANRFYVTKITKQ